MPEPEGKDNSINNIGLIVCVAHEKTKRLRVGGVIRVKWACDSLCDSGVRQKQSETKTGTKALTNENGETASEYLATAHPRLPSAAR